MCVWRVCMVRGRSARTLVWRASRKERSEAAVRRGPHSPHLPTCLLAYLPTWLPTCLLAYLVAYLPTCLLSVAYLPTCLPAYLVTYLPTCLRTYMLAYTLHLHASLYLGIERVGGLQRLQARRPVESCATRLAGYVQWTLSGKPFCGHHL